MAIFLYLFQQMNGTKTIGIDVPLERDENPELVSTEVLPVRVRITIGGAEQTLAKISAADFNASINLSGYEKPGVYTVPINVKTISNTHLIDELNVGVAPSEIIIEMDKRDGNYLPVSPVVRGEPAPGYEIVSLSVNPKQVYVEGPASVVAKLKTLYTEAIDITGSDISVNKSVKINEQNPVLTVNERSVRFEAEIVSIDFAREYNDVPIEVLNLHSRRKINGELPFVNLKIQGNAAIIHEWVPDAGTVYIDCAQIEKKGDYLVPVMVKVPDKFVVLSCEPSEISVLIEDEE